MFDRIFKKFCDKIRSGEYVMTLHAEEEMHNDALTVYDVEHGILTGKVIERQKDRKTGEWKYRIAGHTLRNRGVETITKLGPT